MNPKENPESANREHDAQECKDDLYCTYEGTTDGHSPPDHHSFSLLHQSGAEDTSMGSPCATGSDSSPLTEDEQELLSRSARKRVLLDRLMGHFYSMFSSYTLPSLSIRSHGTSTTGTCPGSGNHDGNQQGESSTNVDRSLGSCANVGQVKRRLPDDEEDGEDKEKKRPRTRDLSNDGPRKMACPYFKNNPQVYSQWRSCPGPGWDSVNRLKYGTVPGLKQSLCVVKADTKLIGNICTGLIRYPSVVHAVMSFSRQVH